MDKQENPYLGVITGARKKDMKQKGVVDPFERHSEHRKYQFLPDPKEHSTIHVEGYLEKAKRKGQEKRQTNMNNLVGQKDKL